MLRLRIGAMRVWRMREIKCIFDRSSIIPVRLHFQKPITRCWYVAIRVSDCDWPLRVSFALRCSAIESLVDYVANRHYFGWIEKIETGHRSNDIACRVRTRECALQFTAMPVSCKWFVSCICQFCDGQFEMGNVLMGTKRPELLLSSVFFFFRAKHVLQRKNVLSKILQMHSFHCSYSLNIVFGTTARRSRMQWYGEQWLSWIGKKYRKRTNHMPSIGVTVTMFLFALGTDAFLHLHHFWSASIAACLLQLNWIEFHFFFK